MVEFRGVALRGRECDKCRQCTKVSFLLNDTKYEYGFSVTDQIVEEEWLFAWPNNRRQMWFEREKGVIEFGDHLKGPNEAVKEVTRPNALFLFPLLRRIAIPQLTALFSWFRSIHPVNASGTRNSRSPRPFIANLSDLFSFGLNEERSLFSNDANDDSLVERIRQLLRSADIGIVDIKRVVSEDEFNSDNSGGKESCCNTHQEMKIHGLNLTKNLTAQRLYSVWLRQCFERSRMVGYCLSTS